MVIRNEILNLDVKENHTIIRDYIIFLSLSPSIESHFLKTTTNKNDRKGNHDRNPSSIERLRDGWIPVSFSSL